MVGTWKLADMQRAALPEKLESAFNELAGSLIGATYIPVLYCGEQIVHGTNHMTICKQIIAAKDAPESLVKMVINCFGESNRLEKINPIE